MKELNKKTTSILIITILMLSMAIALPMASAINPPTLDPINGPVGTKVTVSGSEATAFSLVEIYWENLGGAKLGQGYAGSGGNYAGIKITIPEDVTGEHYVVAKDVATGDAMGTAFTIEPNIILAPTSGLPGDSVVVAGTGFATESTITIFFIDSYGTEEDVTPDPAPETDALGSFEATITVPDVGYGTCAIKAKDGEPNEASKDFEVTATITLTPDEGPTGTVVTIAGKGFAKTADQSVTITVGGDEASHVAPIKTKADGTFTGQFIVPTLAVNVHDVEASAGAFTAKASFDVTETTTIALKPLAGQPSSSVTIEGTGFTAIAGTPVTVKFGTPVVKTLYTNSTGGFKGTFTVPSMPTGSYSVTATDAKGLSDTADFTIAITIVFLDPTEGPTGKEVTITGYGFTDGATVNVTIGTKLVLEDIGVDELHGGTSFIAPTLPVGTYTVKAEDSEGLSFSTSFGVTETTELILTPSSAPVGYIVDIVGNYFSAESTVDVVLYNATHEQVLGPFTTDEDGSFEETFNVPDLDLGDYIVNATDANGLTAEASFSVVEAYREIRTRLTEYNPGDTVRFYVNATFQFDLEIDIEDPSGYPFTSINIMDVDWVKVGDYYVVPYSKAYFNLPSDADEGTWSWTAYEGEEEIANGTFTVGVTVGPQLAITYAPETVYEGDEVTMTVEAEEAPVADVSVWISNPAGDTYILRTTDDLGTCTFTADEAGEWWISAWKDGYTDAYVTIEVLEAVQPELPAETSNEETLDSTGEPKSSFALGETVQAFSEITNVGTESQTMLIVVQFKDPSYRVFAPVFITLTLNPGQSFGYAPGLIIPLAGYTTGTWTAKIMVFDAWPALGGVPIGLPVTLSFTVTS